MGPRVWTWRPWSRQSPLSIACKLLQVFQTFRSKMEQVTSQSKWPDRSINQTHVLCRQLAEVSCSPGCYRLNPNRSSLGWMQSWQKCSIEIITNQMRSVRLMVWSAAGIRRSTIVAAWLSTIKTFCTRLVFVCFFCAAFFLSCCLQFFFCSLKKKKNFYLLICELLNEKLTLSWKPLLSNASGQKQEGTPGSIWSLHGVETVNIRENVYKRVLFF